MERRGNTSRSPKQHHPRSHCITCMWTKTVLFQTLFEVLKKKERRAGEGKRKGGDKKARKKRNRWDVP